MNNENFKKIYEYDPEKEDIFKGMIESVISILRKGKK